jgi:Common central domain of tyrosinase/Tyosinase C-terminal domain
LGLGTTLLTELGRRKQQTMDLFAITDFDRFQTQLESIHNGVHVSVGGSMAVVNYAAFDPIFHLHHTNVDRLMAMYQNIRTNSTMTPGPRSNTLALGGGPAVNDTPTTPLYPFRHTNGVEWTPDELKSYSSIFQLGYSYPEVPPPNQALPTRDTIAAKSPTHNYTVTQANQLYAPDDAANQTRTEYSAVVLLDTAEFTESSRVLLYLSPSPGVQDIVGFAPVFVGHTIAEQSITRVNTTVPLTEALREQNNGSLDPKDVVPFLKDQLFWCIEKVRIHFCFLLGRYTPRCTPAAL